MFTGTVAPSVVPVIRRTVGGSAAGGALSSSTLRWTDPAMPLTVAVIVALPGVAAVKRPEASNVPVAPVTDQATLAGSRVTGLYAASWPKTWNATDFVVN